MIYILIILLLISVSVFFLPVLFPAAVIAYLLWRLLTSNDGAFDETQDENQNKP